MERERLVMDAREAAKGAAHNLQMIRKHPEKMLPGKAKEAEIHLNIMIYFLKMEMKNDRRAGRTLTSRTRLKSLVLLILASPGEKSKGETV